MEPAPPRDVTFRRLTIADISMLHDWLSRPHVAEWWGGAPTSLAEVREDYEPFTLDSSSARGYIALSDGIEIGYIQSYVVKDSGDGWWPEEQDPGARGIDQFLADPDRLGQGLGTAMVRAFVAHLFAEPAVTRVQTDPAPDNVRAIRCYLKAGFRPVAEVDTPDGRALLMIFDERDQVADAAQRLASAIGRRDVGALRDLLAHGFVHRTPGADALDSDAFLRGIELIPGEIVFVRLDGLEIDMCGGGALVTGVQHAQVRLDGALIDDRRPFVDWFVKDRGEWRIRVAVSMPEERPA
jgi:RimJ/RimL family protein N-acetyltransferase